VSADYPFDDDDFDEFDDDEDETNDEVGAYLEQPNRCRPTVFSE